LPLTALAAFDASAAVADGAARRHPALQTAPVEQFRFHAGASLLAPAGAGADGSVCVGTADGYVHVLGPDGTFRWSHSVHGAITHRPLQVGALWFVATSAERIYALTAEGTLSWVFKPPSPVGSELAVDATSVTYFVGADHFLYGVSAHGGVCLRAPFGELKAGPSTAPDGAVWLENQAGNRVRARGQELRRVAADSRPEFDFGSPDAVRDPGGHQWRARTDGVLEFRTAGAAEPSLLELTHVALLSPTWSSAARYVLVSARDGLVVAWAAQGP